MQRLRALALVCLSTGLLSGPSQVRAQAPVNPDISFIGNSLFSISNEPGATDKGRLNLAFDELEMATEGYLNPFARGNVKVSFSNGGVDVEEAYATLLQGLPLRMQLKAGKYLVDLGRINVQHPHQWLWIERPLMYTELFGDEGLKDVGLNLNTLLPVGEGALGLSANLLNEGGLIGEEAMGDPYTPDPIGKAVSGRVHYFVPVGDRTNLDVGASALRAQVNPVESSQTFSSFGSGPGDKPLAAFKPDARFGTVAILDGKLKYKRSEYSGVSLIGEVLLHKRTLQDLSLTTHITGDTTFAVADKAVTTHGAFVAGEVRYLKRFYSGAFFDYTQAFDNPDQFKRGIGLYSAFGVVEETLRFALMVRRNEATGVDPYYSGMFQVLFSLGPHKPHQF